MDFNTKDELKNKVGCFLPRSKISSNERNAIENSNIYSDRNSAKCVDNDVCDNNATEEMSVERVQIMVNYIQISNKLSSTEVIN